MTKNSIFKTLIFVTVVFLTSSCGNGWLDDYETSTFELKEFSSINDLEKIMVGAYYTFTEDNFALNENPGLIYEAMSDNVQCLSDNPDKSTDMERYYMRETNNNELSRVTGVWAQGYRLASQATLAIDFVNEKGTPSDDTKNYTPRILGEAHFLRAYAHFVLVCFFAPPYDPSNLDKPSIILRNKKATEISGEKIVKLSEVYDLIVDDCKKAIENLPENYIAGDHPAEYATSCRAKKDAARFLLAKVYFQMGKDVSYKGTNAWDLALEQMNYIIDKNKYTLGEPKDFWLCSFTKNITSNEIIWEFANTDWKNMKPAQYYCPSKTSQKSAIDPKNRLFAVSESFINECGWKKYIIAYDEFGDPYVYTNTDKRFTQLYVVIDPAADATKNTSYFTSLEKAYTWPHMFSGYAGKGYIVTNNTRVDNKTDYNINTPVMRLGELLLLRATINAVKGNSAMVKVDMDAIRTRTNIAKAASYTLDDVIIEHRKETAFEGKRINYLQALRRKIPAGDPPGLHTTIQRQDEEWNSSKLYWVIPREEEIRNPNLY